VTLNSLADLTRMVSALPGELQQAQVAGVRKSALLITRSIRDEIRTATGGDSRLSGVGRRGARVGARFDVKGSVNVTALIRATGPMQLIEFDTSPHDIQGRKRRRAARGGGKVGVLRFADGGFSMTAHHPGTTGKHPFRRGWVKSRHRAGPTFDAEVQRAIRRVLA
jgi:hypothetical protein